jgi:hypothetical protein
MKKLVKKEKKIAETELNLDRLSRRRQEDESPNLKKKKLGGKNGRVNFPQEK